MLNPFKKNRKKTQPSRYDVNRTLANTAYQPSSQPHTPGKSGEKPVSTGTSAAHQPTEESKKRRFSFKKAFLLLFILILTPLLVIGIWDLKNASKASQKIFGSGDMTGLLYPTSLDNKSGRTNILLVGYSVDDPGHDGAALTDSIMIVSLDKQAKTGYMLSVPRDLYVDIPGYGAAKINEAFQAGDRDSFSEEGYPPGGIGLLEKVVSENFDIPLHYYMLIDYATVRDVVTAFDGITVDIKSPDPEGLFDPNFKPEEGGPLKLANGPQTIDGPTALKLTRARGATAGSYGFPQSDFNRTQNQQQVFSAIKAELDWRVILDPRLNDRIFDALASNIKTDLQLREVLPLFKLFNAVPEGSLAPINLSNIEGNNLLASYQTRSGQSALIPAAGIDDFSQIQAVVERLSQ